jgi:hypothetical protein
MNFSSAAVRLDDALHPLEIAREHPAKSLRVDRLSQRRRAGHVAEQDGDGLPLLARGGRSGEFCAAVRTEGEVAVDLAPADRAGSHGERLAGRA